MSEFESKTYELLTDFGDPYSIFALFQKENDKKIYCTPHELPLKFLPFRENAPLDEPEAFPDIHPVAIIVPVYNAFECLPRLFDTLFAHTAAIHEIIIINDSSPDERVLPYLQQVAKAHTNVR